MKQFKILFLALGFFVQGCETPLIEQDRLLQGNEALVVYHMYYNVPKSEPSFFDPFGFKTWYARKMRDTYTHYGVVWSSHEKEDQKLYARHKMHDPKTNKSYMMAIIPAGTWYAKELMSFYHSGENRMKITSPEFNEQTSPFVFTIQPGEVLYLGDIHVEPSGVFEFNNEFDDAKRYMMTVYPILADRLKYKPLTIRGRK